MKMRWFAAGMAAVLITGGAATVAQRVITQKTRGVLPTPDDPAHDDSRPSPREVVIVPPPGTTIVEASSGSTRPAKDADVPPPDPAPIATSSLDLPAVAAEPVSTESDPGRPSVATIVVGAESPPTEVSSEVRLVATPEGGPAGDPAINPASGPVNPPGMIPAANTSAELPAKIDPVDAVESFVDRNRKEAESAIDTLTVEAANLKTRLAKVESALARWQNFSRALGADQPASQPIVPALSKPIWKRSTPETSARSADPASVEAPVESVPQPAPPGLPTEVQERPPVSPPQSPPIALPGDQKPTDIPPVEPTSPPVPPGR